MVSDDLAPEMIEHLVKSRKKIDDKYTMIHARITREFYEEKTMSKEDFDKQHEACWLNHEAELIENGYAEGSGPGRLAEIKKRVEEIGA